jgi:hypothetical protein
MALPLLDTVELVNDRLRIERPDGHQYYWLILQHVNSTNMTPLVARVLVQQPAAEWHKYSAKDGMMRYAVK